MSDQKLRLHPSSTEEKWYQEGLNFECTGCGGCCTGFPGYVDVTEQEIVTMADHLKLSLNEFSRRYLRKIGDRWSLKELSPNYSCVFLRDKKCTIYELRPKQCRTFPWWPENLASEETWQETARHCEGINSKASKVLYEKIEQNRLLMESEKQQENS